MSHISENVAWQTAQFRRDQGQKVQFEGVNYSCMIGPIPYAQAGADRLPSEALGAFMASTDPQTFRLIPADFAPTTNVAPPQEGKTLIWHGLRYEVTRVSYEDHAEDTHTLIVNAYRKVV